MLNHRTDRDIGSGLLKTFTKSVHLHRYPILMAVLLHRYLSDLLPITNLGSCWCFYMVGESWEYNTGNRNTTESLLCMIFKLPDHQFPLVVFICSSDENHATKKGNIMKKLLLTSAIAMGFITGAHAATPTDQEYVDFHIGQVRGEVGEFYSEQQANNDYQADEIKTINESLYGRPDSGLVAGGPAAGDAVAGLLPGDPAYGLGRGIIADMQVAIAGLGDFSANINKRFDEVDDKISSAAATGAALAGLDNHLDAGKSFGFGFGGGYNKGGAGAVAFGATVRATSSSAINFGGAVSDNGDWSVKGGMNWQF